MKTKRLLSYVVIFMFCSLILFPVKSLASWAYTFVVWDGYVYVITNEEVNEVEKEIGHVTKYSDMEGTYSGNFSNAYPKGTKYYSIKGTSTDEALAVEEENGQYIKAKRDGEYAGNKIDMWNVNSTTFIIGIFIFVLIAILGIYFDGNRLRNRN